MIYYLYKYTHKVSGKGYIGATNNIEKRHKKHATGSSGALAFNRAIIKYTIDAFDFCVLAILDNIDEAARMEQAAIKVFGTLSPDGYNLAGGAPYTKYNGPLSEETRTKMSVARTGRITSEETRKKLSISLRSSPKAQEQRKELHATRIGQKNSPETRAKMSIACKGKKKPPRSAEYRANISAAHKGKPRSPETIKKMSEGNKGRIPWNKGKKGQKAWNNNLSWSEEIRQKISISLKGRTAWNKGIPCSEETKQKLSEAKKGKKNPHSGIPCSDETRSKMSKAQKGRVFTPEWCSKISESKKRYYAAKRAEAEETTHVTE